MHINSFKSHETEKRLFLTIHCLRESGDSDANFTLLSRSIHASVTLTVESASSDNALTHSDMSKLSHRQRGRDDCLTDDTKSGRWWCNTLDSDRGSDTMIQNDDLLYERERERDKHTDTHPPTHSQSEAL